MSLRILLPAVALSTILAACTTTGAPPMSDPQPPPASCNADAARSLVGQPATPANVERARQLAGARMARVLKPGQMVTMEFIEGRLNIDVDDRNVITHVRCG
ncbi:MAG: I78 family peptidase inhibitor [Pseudomonadota bacterium]